MHDKFGKDAWKTFQVIVPTMNVNADANVDAELQSQSPLFLIRIKRRAKDASIFK